jgi:hypothetical protein
MYKLWNDFKEVIQGRQENKMVDNLFPCKQMSTTQKYRDGHDRIFGKKEFIPAKFNGVEFLVEKSSDDTMKVDIKKNVELYKRVKKLAGKLNDIIEKDASTLKRSTKRKIKNKNSVHVIDERDIGVEPIIKKGANYVLDRTKERE